MAEVHEPQPTAEQAYPEAPAPEEQQQGDYADTAAAQDAYALQAAAEDTAPTDQAAQADENGAVVDASATADPAAAAAATAAALAAKFAASAGKRPLEDHEHPDAKRAHADYSSGPAVVVPSGAVAQVGARMANVTMSATSDLDLNPLALALCNKQAAGSITTGPDGQAVLVLEIESGKVWSVWR
jgi:hypothetical protein